MPLDGLLLNSLKTELSKTLINTRVIKVYQPDPDIVLFHLRGQNQTYQLVISVASSHPSIHLSDSVLENPTQAPLFSIVLRKHIEPARLINIEQIALDRIIQFVFEVYEEGNKRGERVLIVELLGRRTNIILVDKKNMVVIDALYRQEGAGDGRALYPGSSYSVPENNKVHPFHSDFVEIYNILRLAPINKRLTDVIVEKYDGFSPFAAIEILQRAGLSPTTIREDLDTNSLEKVSRTFIELIQRVRLGNIEPCCFQGDFWIIPPVGIEDFTRKATLSQALGEVFTYKRNENVLKKASNQLLQPLKKHLSRARRKLNERLREENIANKADSLKEKGDLIISNLYQYIPGMSNFPVVTYTGEKIDILLDPRLDGIGNAQKYYHQYQKQKRAAEALQHQIQLAKMEIAYLQQVITSIELAESPRELEEIKDELCGANIIQKPVSKVKKKRTPDLTILNFRSSKGSPILVGRNNRQNEYLTMKLAHKNDIWLHVKEIPGAHVLLRSKEVDEEEIIEAAMIAAYYSKARYSSNVAVDYTYKKYIRKPQGAPLGYVTYTEEKTVYITPCEEKVLAMKEDNL